MLKPLPFGSSEAMLLIESQVLERLTGFRQIATSAPEAGGILMGYRRGSHTHVTEATIRPACRLPGHETLRARLANDL